MRRHLSLILTALFVLAVLAALSALGRVELDRPPESEAQPRRTSYNAGPTGTRAFYQLLEESGRRVARRRTDYRTLEKEGLLIAVGPFPTGEGPNREERRALAHWIARGGRLLVISRDPIEQFPDPSIRSRLLARPEDWPKDSNHPPEVDRASASLIVQPTALTRGAGALEFSRLASRLSFDDSRDEREEGNQDEALPRLAFPVVHLGDGEGAVLADFDYGSGRVVFLTDPFVVANNGIARGANLSLALNLVETLGEGPGGILFDEYHHGFRETGNPLFTYFRGTPAPWLLAHGLLLALIAAWTAGRRFARPLPLRPPDRHSPLEFVGSMADLQEAAEARDLALENIYPRFRARLTRGLGLTRRASAAEVALALERRRWPVDSHEVRAMMEESERALAGAPVSDERLVALVALMRRVEATARGERRR